MRDGLIPAVAFVPVRCSGRGLRFSSMASCADTHVHISYISYTPYISYLNLLRRVALRQKPFFKGPSDKNLITIYR